MNDLNTEGPVTVRMMSVTAFCVGTFVILASAGYRTWRQRQSIDTISWISYGAVLTVIATILSLNVPEFEKPYFHGYLCGVWIIAALSCVLSGGWLSRTGEDKLHSRRPVFSTVLVCLTALASIAAFLMPEVGDAREAARRSICKSNLRTLGIALHQYADMESRLPGTENGQPPFSWRVALLPYLDQKVLYDNYDRQQHWDSPVNDPVSRTTVPSYQCPSRLVRVGLSRTRDPAGRVYSHYAMLDGPEAVGHGIPLSDIKDEKSSTIMLVEACGTDRIWTSPTDVDTTTQPAGINLKSEMRGPSPGWASSQHRGGAHFLMADGSVRFIFERVDEKLVRAMGTIDGQESIPAE